MHGFQDCTKSQETFPTWLLLSFWIWFPP
jgi:hypothetical protein